MPLFRACPNCGSQIHVRKLACPCGHSVFRGSKPLTTRNASRKSDVGAARALETDEQTAKRRKSDRKRVRETTARLSTLTFRLDNADYGGFPRCQIAKCKLCPRAMSKFHWPTFIDFSPVWLPLSCFVTALLTSEIVSL